LLGIGGHSYHITDLRLPQQGQLTNNKTEEVRVEKTETETDIAVFLTTETDKTFKKTAQKPKKRL